MGGRILIVCTSTILMLLVVVRVVVAAKVDEVVAESANETVKDCSVQNSIKEMMIKLEQVVTPRGVCPSVEGIEPPKPCIDLTSTQSVLTQLCDRLSFMDTKVSGVDSKINLLIAPNHNSDTDDPKKPFTQIAKLREEIKELKRSAVFYASRKDKIANFNHERIINYEVAVNSGVYFNPPSGAFYAPFDGVYHFSLSFQKAPELTLEACLIVDNTVIASTNDEPRHKIDLLTPLKQGQEVWTNTTSNSTPTDSEVAFTFSGYLVH